MSAVSSTPRLTWAQVFAAWVAVPVAVFLVSLLLTLGNVGIAFLLAAIINVPVSLFVACFAVSRGLTRLGVTFPRIEEWSNRMRAPRPTPVRRDLPARRPPATSFREAARIGLSRLRRGDWRWRWPERPREP